MTVRIRRAAVGLAAAAAFAAPATMAAPPAMAGIVTPHQYQGWTIRTNCGPVPANCASGGQVTGAGYIYVGGAFYPRINCWLDSNGLRYFRGDFFNSAKVVLTNRYVRADAIYHQPVVGRC